MPHISIAKTHTASSDENTDSDNANDVLQDDRQGDDQMMEDYDDKEDENRHAATYDHTIQHRSSESFCHR